MLAAFFMHGSSKVNVVIVDDNEINVTLLRHLVKAVDEAVPITFTELPLLLSAIASEA